VEKGSFGGGITIGNPPMVTSLIEWVPHDDPGQQAYHVIAHEAAHAGGRYKGIGVTTNVPAVCGNADNDPCQRSFECVDAFAEQVRTEWRQAIGVGTTHP
jgi:hypothetical protein